MKINGIEVNAKVTVEAVVEACERRRGSLDNPGFCILCGCEADGCEPDARNHECESCGAEQVFGCEWLAIEMM